MAGIFLPAGYSMTLTASSVKAGNYMLIDNPDTYTVISAGSNSTIGPFNDPRQYDVNDLTISQSASGFVTAVDDAALALKAPLASPTFTGTVVLPSGTSIGNVSSTEIGYLDNVSSAIQTQLNAKMPTAVTSNIGTPGSGVTAAEYGSGYDHTTVLTISSSLPNTIAGAEDRALGKLIYTLPAGAQVVHAAYMSVGITQTSGNINADTPDVGLGTSLAAGNQALLSGVGATAENIITGQTAANCTGTATVKTMVGSAVVSEVGDAKTIYLNAADGWAGADAGPLIAGTVVLHWYFFA